MYETVKLPENIRTSTFISIPKKNNIKKCSEFRTISLMSHTLKILLAISNPRIERKIDDHLDETQPQ